MPLYEITLTASKVVKVHAADDDAAEAKALSANETLDEVEVTDTEEIEPDPTHYEELPDHIREVVDRVESGEELKVLGVGQTGNRVYDDGEWRVWAERAGPADGYDGPGVSVEFYNGHRWSDFNPEAHGFNDDED